MEPNVEQELKLQLFEKLISLQVEAAAMRSVLQNCRIWESKTDRLLDWGKVVEHHREAINNSFPAGLYSEAKQELISSTHSASELARLVTIILETPIPI